MKPSRPLKPILEIYREAYPEVPEEMLLACRERVRMLLKILTTIAKRRREEASRPDGLTDSKM